MTLGSYFDPEGVTESHTTVYTLTVFTPSRPQPKWLHQLFTRQPSWHPKSGSTSKLPASAPNPKHDCSKLKDMPTKIIRIKSCWFPADLRCEHVQGLGNGNSKKCEAGCYFFEEGGKQIERRCKSENCNGHVYSGRVKKDKNGKSCFGKKRNRIVCLER
jgi:hypothetical protein